MSPGAKKTERPIVIVKRIKRGENHGHGGAWKVAYADFVTSMMAFFMVMWLIASVDKEQRAAIFNYFKNPSMEEGRSVKPAPGRMGPGGASTSMIQLGGALELHPAPAPLVPHPHTESTAGSGGNPSVEEARRLTEAAEHKKLESLMAELRKAIDESQALKPFKDQLLLDITPEGLRIQIVDSQNRAMFDIGSAKLKGYTAQILHELAPYLDSVSNRISVSGHTDVTPYTAQAGYNNWDLSADRANAARRALEAGGLAADKVARVVGLSSAVLFDNVNKRAAVNRRISIIVMTKEAEQAALNIDTAPEVSAQQLPNAVPGGPPVAAPAGAPAAMPAGATVPPPAASAVSGTAPAAASVPPAAPTSAPAQ